MGGFCSGDNPHKPDCEYFVDGGMAVEEVPKTDLHAEATPAEVPEEDLVSAHGEEVPKHDILAGENESAEEVPEEDMASPGLLDKAKTMAEGFSQGLFGDIAKVAEVKSGLSTLPEIEKREQQSSGLHGATKVAGRIAPFMAGPEGGVGSAILRNLLMGVSYAASDNIEKAMLGQPGGDPKSAVAATLIDGGVDALTYTLTDGLFAAGSKGIKSFQSPEVIKTFEKWMTNFAEKPLNKIAEWGAGAYAAKHGHPLEALEGLTGYEVLKSKLEPMIEKIIGSRLTKANSYVGDAILNALAKTNFLGVPAATAYAQKASKGMLPLAPALDAIFKSGSGEVTAPAKEFTKDAIKEWIDSGGVDGEIARDQQPSWAPGYAKGGEIHKQPSAFASLYPAENGLLNEARGRISNYLRNIKPHPNVSKLPFDSEPSQTQKKKDYEGAIALAAHPLSILNHVNKGDITPEMMRHFTSMYPEVHDLLARKMTDKITQAQLKGEKPPYGKRQAMSLFLGTDLDSTFSPLAIQTIQATYAGKKMAQQQQVPTKNKKGTSSLSKASNAYKTDEQARESRMQNQKA